MKPRKDKKSSIKAGLHLIGMVVPKAKAPVKIKMKPVKKGKDRMKF